MTVRRATESETWDLGRKEGLSVVAAYSVRSVQHVVSFLLRGSASHRAADGTLGFLR